jgi:hypothetical protein
MDALQVATLTVLNGQSLSDAVDLSGWDVVALRSPASVEASAFGFKASLDGSNFFDVNYAWKNSSGDFVRKKLEYPSSSSEYAVISNEDARVDWRSIRWLKLEMRSGGSPINVGANRVFELVLRRCN